MDHSTGAIANEMGVSGDKNSFYRRKLMSIWCINIILFNSRLVSLLISHILEKTKEWCHGKQLEVVFLLKWPP